MVVPGARIPRFAVFSKKEVHEAGILSASLTSDTTRQGILRVEWKGDSEQKIVRGGPFGSKSSVCKIPFSVAAPSHQASALPVYNL
eukprot:3198516-Amphidinium_carterae.2